MKIIILFVFLLAAVNVYSQENYWQQQVNYEIHVRLNDKCNSLHANIKIDYYNNSPHTLKYIKFHLWPNAYKNSSTALCQQMLDQGDASLYYADEIDRGYIDSLEFSDESGKLKWEINPDTIDIATIYLNKELKPGEHVQISTPFYVKIPSSEFSRLGHYLQSYQITQWYPKPAVFDKSGWHAFPYLNQGEFYSEFGSFDVYITLPRNYVVGATGDLVDAKEEEAWLDSIAEADARISHFKSSCWAFPPSDSVLKTLHYHQDKVHDFAWFADKRFHVLKDEVVLKSGHKVTCWSMFTNEEADLWVKSPRYLKRAVKFYSEQVGEYPYNQVTAVQGTLSAGAGMEYPNITIIGEAGDDKSLDNVIMHEVGHNWFYGMLGFNERDHPWMDEGLNTYIESLYMQKYYPKAKLSDYLSGLNLFHAADYSQKYESYFSNLFQWRRNQNQSLALPAQDFTPINYGVSVYMKTGLYMRYLRAWLGEKEARRIMRDFFDQWAYKHPQPEDFKAFWEKESGQNLDWFFDELINSTKTIDYKISRLNKSESGDSVSVTVRNKTKVAAPLLITGIKKDGTVKNEQWYPGFTGSRVMQFPKGDYDLIRIDGKNIMPDVYRGNDMVHTKGLVKKRKMPRLSFAWTLPKDNRPTLFWTPVIGWNMYNRFMLGAAFYNSLLFEKKWQYSIMPMYSFEQKNVNGSFSLFRNFYTTTKLYRISVGITGRKYNEKKTVADKDGTDFQAGFARLVPQVIFYFNPQKSHLTSITKMLTLRVVMVSKNSYKYVAKDVLEEENDRYDVYEASFVNINKRRINPYSYRFLLHGNSDFWRLTSEFQYRLSYGKARNSGFDMRLFAGLTNRRGPTNGYQPLLRMAGTSGWNDYLYDGVFLGRNEYSGIWSQQMIPNDGGFYVPTILGSFSDWLIAVNLRASVPKLSFIKAYMNIGFDNSFNGNTETLWEAGMLLSVVDRKFEVYFPFLWSKEIQDVFDLNNQNSYGEKIRFTMRLELLNPVKYLKEVRF